jgi:hypothetical protein
VARLEEKRNWYITLVQKPEANRLLGRLRHKWENNIKIRDTHCNDGSRLTLTRIQLFKMSILHN